ncbi:MAG: DUF1565 domain-containing protein [Haloarculaceae archaeon]
MVDRCISRRRLLAAVGGIGVLAGCTSTTEDESQPSTATPDGVDQATEQPTTSVNPDQTSTPSEETEQETPTEQATDVIYLSPNGDDGNPGTEDEPMATVQQALVEVGPGDTIHLQPGEYTGKMATIKPGEPDNPITITGPKEAVLRPSKEVDEKHWNPLVIQHSHYRLTGITITGLHTPDAPDQPESYVKRLLKVSPRPESSEYVEDVTVAPHGIGNSQTQLINVIRAKDCEFGPFKMIGPAGVEYLHGDKQSHQGEILYLGSPLQTYADGADGYFWDEYDRTRNIHVHHIDNSEGYHHSEIVDCKDGTENITIEYCTDAGGSRNTEPFSIQSIHVRGHNCTFRWNRLAGGEGNGIEVYKPGSDELYPEFGFDEEVVDRISTDNEIYGNEIHDFGNLAIAFDNETRDAQRHVCGNDIRGETNGMPEKECAEDLPRGDGIGHTGGNSPWS